MLGLYCRAENNRVFLRNRIEMRPGFLAKWIEFKFLDADTYGEDPSTVLSMMKDRWELMKYGNSGK